MDYNIFKRMDMSVNDYERFPLSWMPDKSRIVRPQYLSLASLLEQAISSGQLLPGTLLPPQRALADYLDLNFTTVTRAYDLCREKNLIYGVIGRGTFVAPRQNQEQGSIAELGVVLGFPNVIKPVVDAARIVVQRDTMTELFSYRERNGLERHRAAGIQWMAKFGAKTDMEHTAVFAGAQNAITTALLSLFHVGDMIAVDEFTYANFIEAARLTHLRLIPIENDGEGMIPESLERRCQKNKICGIFIMPECANPTGVTLSEVRRDALASVCEKYRLIVIEDDSSVEIDTRRRPIYDRLPLQTLYIAASTRHLAPGLRITFAAFPERYRNALMHGLFHTSIKAAALDAEIISQLIFSGDAENILAEKYQLAIEANRCFEKHFSSSRYRCSIGSYFRTVPVLTNEKGPEFEQRLLSQGLRVCHSYRFSVQSNPHHAFLRISLSSMSDINALEQALNRLRSLLSSVLI